MNIFEILKGVMPLFLFFKTPTNFLNIGMNNNIFEILNGGNSFISRNKSHQQCKLSRFPHQHHHVFTKETYVHPGGIRACIKSNSFIMSENVFIAISPKSSSYTRCMSMTT
jgi:hypothetical protein